MKIGRTKITCKVASLDKTILPQFLPVEYLGFLHLHSSEIQQIVEMMWYHET